MRLTKRERIKILKGAIAPYDNYCEGYGNSKSSGNNYLLGFILAVGKTPKQFSHIGSQMLDEINAFDLAEIEGPYIGQINMSIVSSFCGPQGMIWGYDICENPDLLKKSNFFRSIKFKNQKVDTYYIYPLIESIQGLFGTVDKRRFILRPGAHVPCAGKNIKVKGPGVAYSAIAVGIPKDRKKDACLLMEDVGIVSSHNFRVKEEVLNSIVLENIAKSVIQVGNNQRVEYEKILVGAKFAEAKKDEIACALVAAPYFTLAKNAIGKKVTMNKFVNLTNVEWEAQNGIS